MIYSKTGSHNSDRNLHIFTYATENYYVKARVQGITAAIQNFKSFVLFGPNDLADVFKIKNSETLELTTGAGYWLWKPYFLQKKLNSHNSQDFILYLDAGALPYRNASFYQQLCTDGKIHVWEIEGARISQWTDRRARQEFNLLTRFEDAPMIWAGAILGRVSGIFHDFSQLWLENCLNYELLRPDSTVGYTKSDGLFWHRHDQSILSMIIATHPDWFTIHSSSRDRNSLDFAFDQHRSNRVKIFSLLYGTFPRLRALRRRIVRMLPKRVQSRLRYMLFLRAKKRISKEEVNSIRSSF